MAIKPGKLAIVVISMLILCNMNTDVIAFLMNVIRRLDVGQIVVLIEGEKFKLQHST